nr:c-type cytochrome [Massilia endophytica]
MKYVIAASLLSVVGMAAHAATPEELAKSKNCMACHAIDKKMVGPAYKDVAAKYKGQKGAEDKLVQKVLKGGSGTWGAVPMPPNAVSDAEAHALVKWVLSM